ncbi:hypothetical protein CONPUDRAFT_82232 [Coniophora puteana RWD-64-598 SS2]|uniref:Secreted protein n=1 Tax=Coniophora puteana (strain RWD-64-598) TaxID=741705 RepID=A0A5M3MQ77_CONPW|nr:uncharacterized protein CONPUDRAFT_82232 [Coniophora puteana RWD-64-598 SS2]EIW81207.1 hypothetical protein CONPUDRAFT_82232 [Coniophora puteana RWD-64-598 SS2]
MRPAHLLLAACASPVLSLTIPLAAWEAVLDAYDHLRHPNPPAALAKPSEYEVGWADPRLNGGRFLDFTTPKAGEPLNVIISNESDPYILTEPGFRAYYKSIGFSEECLGLHIGHIHDADLGDGEGRKGEHILARQYYFPRWGTCWESIAGGNHFRAWKQNGTDADTGAWFLAVSKEENSSKNHMIVPDGYNIGRDLLVENAAGVTHWNGMWWQVDVEWREGLLAPGHKGVNHKIAQDGRVAILTVNRL